MGPYFGKNASIWVLIGSVFSLELGPYWVRLLPPWVLKNNWKHWGTQAADFWHFSW